MIRLDDTTPIEARARLLEQLARDAARTPAVLRLLETCQQLSGPTFSARALAEQILSLVHRYRYAPTLPGEWVPESIDEVISARAGDCKGLTALALALFASAGIQARATWLLAPTEQQARGVSDGRPRNHVLPQVYVDGAWWSAETTRPGARLTLSTQTQAQTEAR